MTLNRDQWDLKNSTLRLALNDATSAFYAWDLYRRGDDENDLEKYYEKLRDSYDEIIRAAESQELKNFQCKAIFAKYVTDDKFKNELHEDRKQIVSRLRDELR